MPITKSDIAERFNNLADLLELQRASQYRVQAHRNAARTRAGLPRSVADLLADEQELSTLHGICDALAGKIGEIARAEHLTEAAARVSRVNRPRPSLPSVPCAKPRKTLINRQGFSVCSQTPDFAAAGGHFLVQALARSRPIFPLLTPSWPREQRGPGKKPLIESWHRTCIVASPSNALTTSGRVPRGA